MPLALVSRSKRVENDLLGKVMRALPDIIAENLGVPDHPLAKLAPKDIEVSHLESPFNIGHHDIQIVILAQKFEERIRDGVFRSECMVADVQKILDSDMTCFVWVFLGNTFFAAT